MRQASIHGGALDAAMRAYGGERQDWLDLSTGINPVPPELPALPAELWTRLPEAALEAAAIRAARRLYGAPAEAALVAAPGSQALISLLPHLLPPGPAAVLAPSYGEHCRALEAAGHAVLPFADPGAVPAEARLAVLVNPNNPDGRRFGRAAVLDLADAMAARSGLLVVDEAFMDADPRETVADAAGRPGLAVLRSFGKFFGFAGVRLGFALCDPGLGARLADRLGPWAVSGPALGLAAELMGDTRLVEALRVAIARRGALTRRALREGGLDPEGDAALFAHLETPGAAYLFEALARRHILTRPFADAPHRLRFGQVRGEAEAARLAEALNAARAEGGAVR